MCPGLVHITEQSVEGHAETDENHMRPEITDDPHTGETLVTYNVDRRRRSVAADNKLVGNIDEADRTGEHHG